MNTIFAANQPAGQRAQSEGSRLLAAAYERHAETLLSYIRNDLGADWHEAEDLVAEVWLRMTENLDRVDNRALDLKWLQIIARFVVRYHGTANSFETLVGFTGDEPVLAPQLEDEEQQDDDEPVGRAQAYYRAHGDPQEWATGAEFEVYENLAQADAAPAARVPASLRPRRTGRGGVWYTARQDAEGWPTSVRIDQVVLYVTRRGHWYRSDDERNGNNDRVCRGCGGSGHWDYILDGANGDCPRPPAAEDIREALQVVPWTPVELPTPVQARPARAVEEVAAA
ncbi:RNA polymerase sigma factor [Streptomyces malaysiensis]|uniref:RNA polymerase sigma factor n=1 Tax=Streptomyces malaysiensis TaxID=92644 RepID=UPI0008529547|nr:sigma factor [Streptomyces sp. SPMA113]